MRRLAAAIGCDVRLQWRNGFYGAVAFLLAGFLLVVGQLPPFDAASVLPPLLLGNLMVATFYFMGGLLLLEKGEGILESLVVTPLAAGEYLLAKVLTLTALSVAESFAITLFAHGPDFGWPALFAGVTLAAALYCLLGFLVVIRYDSINEYLFPTILYTAFFVLPILDYAGLWGGGWMYLHPFQPSLLLMDGAFRGTGSWLWLYGISYSLLWIGLSFAWSVRVFRRFVVAQAGASG